MLNRPLPSPFSVLNSVPTNKESLTVRGTSTSIDALIRDISSRGSVILRKRTHLNYKKLNTNEKYKN